MKDHRLDEVRVEGSIRKRSRQEAVVNLSSHNASNDDRESNHGQESKYDRGDSQATTSDLVSSKKRKSCFQDLDTDDFRAAKKICVTVTPMTTTGPGTTLFSCDGFTSLYSLGRMLGEGSFGSVYEGIRTTDGRKVAVKYISKEAHEEYFTFPGTSVRLPVEVTLHLLVSRPPLSEPIVQLLDWFDQADKFVLVMEYPAPCMDVFNYMDNVVGGPLTEDVARSVMQQVVQASQHCRDRGVLHRDIKGENLLLQTDSMKVKLIDFGCGDLLKDEPYDNFSGTSAYCPPEWYKKGSYDGEKATVWSLGLLLYTLINNKLPFKRRKVLNRCKLRYGTGISKECKNLISRCLNQNAKTRPTLEEILQSDWLSIRQ